MEDSMNFDIKNFTLIYLCFINIIGLASMGIDKKRSLKKQWRISENTLLLIAFIGGGIGSFAGMILFRHKIKKTKFKLLVPLSFFIYLYLLHIGHGKG